MPTFAVTQTLPPDAASTKSGATPGRRMLLIPQDGTRTVIGVPYAPKEVSHSKLAADYATVARVGRRPALVYKNGPLPMLSFSLLVAFPKRPSRVQAFINLLGGYAERGVRVRVSYGSMESGLWRITSLKVDSKQRHQNTSEIVQAELDVELTRASDLAGGDGPVRRGAIRSATEDESDVTRRVESHEVREGETLTLISILAYGTPSRWRQIGDANNVTNPRNLRVGQILRIP